MAKKGENSGGGDVGGGSGESSSNIVSSSSLLDDKGSKNKRKFIDPLLEGPVNVPLSLDNSQNSSGHVGSLHVGMIPRQVIVQESDWDDPVACQLEESLLSNLHAIFQNAIKQIVKCGYSEGVAQKAISTLAFYRGGKDLVADIVNDALEFLKKGNDASGLPDKVFEDLQSLVKFTMVEMVSVLREVKPSLSTAEAMWWLLICDLRISQACVVDDLLSELASEEVSVANSDSTFSEPDLKEPDTPKSVIHDAQNFFSEALKFGCFSNPTDPSLHGFEHTVTTMEQVLTTTRSSAFEDKPNSGRKVHKKEYVSRMKSFYMERCHKHHCRSTIRLGTLASISDYLMEKRIKPPSKAPTAKGSTSKTKAKAEVSMVDQIGANAQSTVSVTRKSSDPESSVSSEKKLTPMSEASSIPYPKPSDYLIGIPYDEPLGKYMPKDVKDEQILKLVSRVQELHNELQSWNEWANQKVMQATRKLSKDKAELKALRQEKEEAEQFKKEKKTLEENTLKRLSEMQLALDNATSQVEMANSTISRLEVEQSQLKKQAEAAKLCALESETSRVQALEREQKALKDAQSWEGQKSLFLEELEAQKKKVAKKKKELSKAQNLRNQIKAKQDQEKVEMGKLLAQAASLKSEREQLEAAGKAEEDAYRQKADSDIKKYQEDIKKLEEKISGLKLKQDAWKIAALKKGLDGKPNLVAKGSLPPHIVVNNVPSYKDDVEYGGLRWDRECVMCLSEEMSVVFIPCAHQVLCKNCSELHEKQGMKDCPSCRTPIKNRIPARFRQP